MSSTARDGKARQSLREFYEQLDRKWVDAEALLVALDVPTPVCVRIKTVGPERRGGTGYHHELGFVKHYGRWGVCYGVRSVEDPEDCIWTPIRRCSFEQRVEAARLFPELRDKVLQAADTYAAEVEQALGVLTRTLDESAEIPAGEARAATGAEHAADIAPEPTIPATESHPARLPALRMTPALLRWESDGGQSTQAERHAA